MDIQQVLLAKVKEAVSSIFKVDLPTVEFQPTRKDFEGDITVVIFPMLRYVKGNPELIGKQIGEYLQKEVDGVSGFNVVKGFLNIIINDGFYLDFFNSIKDVDAFGYVSSLSKDAVMVEYSSPNTNKPLHLGHIRNNLLGYSVAEILKASGKKVYKTQIINDRGIHICKSMLAWQKFAPKGKDGKKETPETTEDISNSKGDKFVGKYYVRYNTEYEKERKTLVQLAQDAYDEYRKPNPIPEIAEFKTVLKPYKKVSLNNNVFWALGGLALASYLYSKSKKEGNENLKNLADLASMATVATAVSSIEFRKEYKAEYERSFEPRLKDLEKRYGNRDIDERQFIKEYIEENKEYFPLLREAQQMLRKWEAGDEQIVSLWKKMNGWVYKGFDITYKNLGVDFDQLYYESDTYLLGKDVVSDGLEKGVFYKKEDGSVWIDLTDEGLDEKIVLRSDGTAVYMTQDIGTAIQRVKDYPDIGGMVYTVGNEQDYHFKVLFLILKKIGFSWAERLHHLSYGMVDLPSGKMKSREGTVVDADDLMDDMTQTAASISEELGKLEDYSEAEKKELYKMIGLGALKYYILKVDPKKRILFNPEESVDFQGNTGPFIQYTYARIQSILRKAQGIKNVWSSAVETSIELHPKEKELIKQIQLFPETIQLAAENYSPALIANYTYDLVKEFNSFYQQVSILGESNEQNKILRVQLSKKVGEVIQSAFRLLGIYVPERM